MTTTAHNRISTNDKPYIQTTLDLCSPGVASAVDLPVTAGDGGASLGILTKSHSTPAIAAFERVHAFILQDQAAALLPKERVGFCLKRRIDKTKNAVVMLNETLVKAQWGNLVRCGSIWACPVCAKKITEKRRLELAKANREWKKGVARAHFNFKSYPRGFVGPIDPVFEYFTGYTYLITLTNSHNASHSLLSLKLGQRVALKHFFGDRLGISLFDDLGKKFHITNYEVTYGKNGWHPHHHILVFSTKYLSISDFSALEQKLKAHWISCCLKADLPLPNMEHGLDLRDGTYADQYIGKWGIEHEMTKGHVKHGREGSATPFDLLRLSFKNEALYKRRLPSTLFQEFVIAFKGARQLAWSEGLKGLFGIDDKSDAQLVAETDNQSIELRQVDEIMFCLLVRYQKRHEFLKWCEQDWRDGCWGSGQVERNMDKLLDMAIKELDEGEGEFLLRLKSLIDAVSVKGLVGVKG